MWNAYGGALQNQLVYKERERLRPAFIYERDSAHIKDGLQIVCEDGQQLVCEHNQQLVCEDSLQLVCEDGLQLVCEDDL